MLSRTLSVALSTAFARSGTVNEAKLRDLSKIVGSALIEKFDSGVCDPAILRNLALAIVSAHLGESAG
jgi:hypothetical protein